MSRANKETPSAYGPTGHRWYALTILSLVYGCHALDRSLPNILVEPIRHEFNLSDAQLGMLTGMAFGLAFSVASVPLGIWADRVRSRRALLAGIVMVWSLMTALSGFVRSFGQLLLVRLALGAGEAGTLPIALPMISDIFPVRLRSLAIGIFYMSVPLGGLLAMAAGGHIAAAHGWRAAFFIASVPGILTAVLLVLTVRDPRRGESDEAASAEREQTRPRMGDAFRFLAKNPGLIWLILGCATFSLAGVAVAAWTSSFFIRIHGMGLATTGLLIGLVSAGSAAAASPVTGWAADHLAKGDPAWRLRVVWICALASLVTSLVQFAAPGLTVAIIAFALSDMFRSYPGPAFGVLMTHTPPAIRGLTMSITTLITNLLAFGVGPVLTGGLSDLLGGGAALRYALLIVTLLFGVAAIFFMLANRSLLGAGVRTSGSADQVQLS